MEGSFEKIKIENLPEGDKELNSYRNEIMDVSDAVDHLKAAIAVEQTEKGVIHLLRQLEDMEIELEGLKEAMKKRKKKIDEEKGCIGNA